MAPGSATAARPAYSAVGAATYRPTQAVQGGLGGGHAYAPSQMASRMTGGPRPTFSRSASFNYHGRVHAAVLAPPFHYYRNFGYRTFQLHDRFPAFLLINTNFILNYYIYNLAPAPPGYVWVRFGPDALLVNTYTGDIIDSATGLFAEGDPSLAATDPNAPPPPDGPPPAYGQASASTDTDGVPYPGPNGLPPPSDGGPPTS